GIRAARPADGPRSAARGAGGARPCCARRGAVAGGTRGARRGSRRVRRASPAPPARVPGRKGAAVSGTRIDGRSFAAAQAFLLGAKSYWTKRIFPAVRAEYDERVAREGARPETAADAKRLMAGSTLYAYYAWLERHLQRYK